MAFFVEIYVFMAHNSKKPWTYSLFLSIFPMHTKDETNGGDEIRICLLRSRKFLCLGCPPKQRFGKDGQGERSSRHAAALLKIVSDLVDCGMSGFLCEPLRVLSKALYYSHPNKGNQGNAKEPSPRNWRRFLVFQVISRRIRRRIRRGSGGARPASGAGGRSPPRPGSAWRGASCAGGPPRSRIPRW